MTDTRFQHFEVVRARENPPGLRSDVTQQDGVILGISSDDETDEVWYAVAFGDQDTVMMPEDLLVATGRHSERSAIYDGTSVRVSREGRAIDGGDGAVSN